MHTLKEYAAVPVTLKTWSTSNYRKLFLFPFPKGEKCKQQNQILSFVWLADACTKERKKEIMKEWMLVQSNHRWQDSSLIIWRRVHDTLSYKEFLILPKNLQQNLFGIRFCSRRNQRAQMAALLCCSLSLQLHTLALFPVKLISGRQGGRGKKKLDADSLVRFGYVAGSIIRRRAYRAPG
jgi:hypothetical protein